MNKRILLFLIATPFILTTPSLVHAEESFDLDAIDFNFDQMPERTLDFIQIPEKKDTLQTIKDLTSLTTKIVQKEVVSPLDELCAKHPHLLALASVSTYVAGSTYGVSSWKKGIYALFPYLLLRGILKKIEQSKSA